MKMDFDRIDDDQSFDGLTRVDLHPNLFGMTASRMANDGEK